MVLCHTVRLFQGWSCQKSVLGLVLFTIFIKDLDNAIGSIKCIKFMDDTKLGGAASTLEDKIIFQNYLDKLEKWSKNNKKKFNKNKCKALRLGRRTQTHKYKAENNW